jgi:hypothetical protein
LKNNIAEARPQLFVLVWVFNVSIDDLDVISGHAQQTHRPSQQRRNTHKDNLHCPPQYIDTSIFGDYAYLICEISDTFRATAIDMTFKRAPQKNNHKD